MNGATMLLRALRLQDISTVFGILGREGASIRFNEVEGVRFLLTRHEFTAGIAADVFARASRRPQVCFSTLGPGATNLVTPVASASLDRSPLIAISAQAESYDLHYGHTQQCIDQVAMMAPLCKYATEITDITQIPLAVHEAFRAAWTEPLGPSFLSISIDVFRQTMDDELAWDLLSARPTSTPFALSEPSSDQLNSMWDILERAANPIAVVGNFVIRGGATEGLQSFVEKFGLPCVTSYTGKSALPSTHPLNLGTISPYVDSVFEGDHLDSLFGPVDAILLLGYDYVEDIRPEMWEFGQKKTIVRVAAFPNPLPEFRVDLDVITDLSALFRELNSDRFPTRKPERAVYGLPTARQQLLEKGKTPRASVVSPEAIIGVVNGLNRRDLVLVVDVGLHRVFAGLLAEVEMANTFFTSCGLATFGFALPAAIGAHFAFPDRNIVAICGDGGFHSVSQDLETLARLRVPVVILVFEDRHMGLIRAYESIDGSDPNPDTVEFLSVDFVALARANGCQASLATTSGDLATALHQGLATRTPTVIQVPVSYSYSISKSRALSPFLTREA